MLCHRCPARCVQFLGLRTWNASTACVALEPARINIKTEAKQFACSMKSGYVRDDVCFGLCDRTCDTSHVAIKGALTRGAKWVRAFLLTLST